MTLPELDAITYLMQCERKKTDQESKINQAKSKMK